MSARDLAPAGKYLVDTYLEWAAAEGAPVVEGDVIDLAEVETGPWARFGLDGAICHVTGRCDFLTAFVYDLPAGAACPWSKALYEELLFVVDGEGFTEIDQGDGEPARIDWTPGAIVAVPGNARRRHTATGARRARLAGFNDCRYLMNLYRNEAFVFDNPCRFPADSSDKIIRDPVGADLPAGEASSSELAPGGGVLGATLRRFGPNARRPAERQMQGRHALGLSGEGATVSFAGADQTPRVTRWRRGVLFGLEGMVFHQHGSVGGPAAMMTIEMGSLEAPMLRSRRASFGEPGIYSAGAATIAVEETPAPAQAAWDDLR